MKSYWNFLDTNINWISEPWYTSFAINYLKLGDFVEKLFANNKEYLIKLKDNIVILLKEIIVRS